MYSTGNIKRIISKTKRNDNLRFPSTFQRQISLPKIEALLVYIKRNFMTGTLLTIQSRS